MYTTETSFCRRNHRNGGLRVAADLRDLARHTCPTPEPNVLLRLWPHVTGEDGSCGRSGATMAETMDGIEDGLAEGDRDEGPDPARRGVTPHHDAVPVHTRKNQTGIFGGRRVLSSGQGFEINRRQTRMSLHS